MVWLDDQWNQPSRSDHYLMQIALEVARVLSTEKDRYKIDWYKLHFQSGKQQQRQQQQLPTQEEVSQQIARSKATWISAVKSLGNKVRRPPTKKHG